MTKKFLLEIKDSPRTRWLDTDEHILHRIAQVASGVVSGRTEGEMPTVTVMPAPDGMDEFLAHYLCRDETA